MDALRVVPFPPRPSATSPLAESPHARAFLTQPGDALPEGAELTLALPDGARFVYAPTAPGGGAATEIVPDPFVRGNQFKPLHDSPRAQAALISIAAARRVDSGPESERFFLMLRGAGLVFDQSGETARFEPHTLVVAPAGEPARLWSQGPEDVLAVVFQPKGVAVPRRTLASEIAKRRAATDGP